MIRLFAASIAVIASSAAAMGYIAMFNDELDPQHPANVGAGLFAARYRHWIEYVIIVWTVMPLAGISIYSLLGTRSLVIVNWPVVRRYMFRLHAVSGAVILLGLLIAVVNQQPIHWRDAITAIVGFSLLAISALERSTNLKSDRRSAIWSDAS